MDLIHGQGHTLEIWGSATSLKAIRGHLVQPSLFTQTHNEDKLRLEEDKLISPGHLSAICAQTPRYALSTLALFQNDVCEN